MRYVVDLRVNIKFYKDSLGRAFFHDFINKLDENNIQSLNVRVCNYRLSCINVPTLTYNVKCSISIMEYYIIILYLRII